jgi:hypothetical protein
MNDSGAWCSEYSFHYAASRHYFDNYITLIDQLAGAEIRHRESGNDYEGLIEHLTNDLRSSAYRAATSAHLYACLSIEGFLNFYGVRRLGEHYYKKHLEQLPLIVKLERLFLTLLSTEPSDELKSQLTTVFRNRNNLVHPKTREINHSNLENFIDPHPRNHYAHQTMQALEKFIDELCAGDKELSKDFYFPTEDD